MGDLRNDIEKYLRGELSPTERHALEKRALSDPFLADALEGGESISVEDFSADLKSLQHSLGQRTKRNDDTKVVPMWSWTMRIAAGLLIVAVAAFVVYQITDKQRDVQIAQTDPSVTKTPSTSPKERTSADSAIVDEKDYKPTITESSAVAEKPKPVVADKPRSARRNDLAPGRELEPETGVSTQSATPEKEDAVAKVPPMKSQPTVETGLAEEKNQADRIAHHFTITDTVRSADIKLEPLDKTLDGRVAGVTVESHGFYDNLAKKTADVPPAASAPVIIRGREKDAAGAETKVVKGKVISADDGAGLPGVNVTIKGTDTGTITDAEGNYQLTLDPSVSGLVFSFIGMESQEVTLEDATQVNVAMNQDMTQLSEVVVTGFGMDADEDTKGRITFATPSGGRSAFKKYIESSMQYPEQALVNEVEGRVTIQFTVESSGALTEIKVIRGIGYGCDEEVIRLIKEGPKWNPTRRDDEPIKGRVKVRVRFKLPKK